MKKIIAVILCIIIVLSALIVVANEMLQPSEEQGTVAGLQEKMDALWMKNNFSQEELNEMVQQWKDWYTEIFYQTPWEARKSLDWRWIKYDNEAEELAYRLETYKPDPEKGYLISCLITERYAEQYANNNHFGYLISDEPYWIAPAYFLGNRFYTREGILSENGVPTPYGRERNAYITGLSDATLDFLKNTDNTEQLLLEKGEIEVSDIKVFGMSMGLSFMYIRCDEQEYLVELSNILPGIDQYKLYPAKEVIEVLTETVEPGGWEANSVWDPDGGFGGDIIATKPTYQTEAEALEAEGLLKGNENGLDLLKPLTRIEAAAMLLRAMGEIETAPPNSGQVFTDVPQSHWGFGAATNAYDLGIVNGIGNNQFAPDNLVTAAQFSTMVLRAADTGEFDWQQATNLLIDQGVITAEEVETMDLFTRGDMAKIIYEAREKGLLQ